MASRSNPRVLHRRRIIERPRLLALLDGSTARVRTLIAPAGYGKTTLAEQWIGQEGRRSAWFTARPSSTDVAALALGLARAATVVVPGCDVRLREHLRALPAPGENVEVLAELLGEDLEAWPEAAWLVLDDYHEIAATEDAERFVDELVGASPIQLLLASRQRPSWITNRRILYGEVLELNQTELAMDGHEAAEVMSERNAASASGLVALANGWPAVIGLASVSAAEIDERAAVPEALYEFFAEEVFSSLPEEVQSGLAKLVIAPVIDRALATKLLGDSFEGVCAAALDVGVLVERGSQLEIHPLARAFLEARLERLAFAPDDGLVEACLTHFRERRDWDTAFDLVVRYGRPRQLGPLLEQALDELLETARLSTIEQWCVTAPKDVSASAAFLLARAEVALRRGNLAEAQAHAEAAAAHESSLRHRALVTAGRAAHLGALDVEALALYRRAEAAAMDEASRREARWAQIICMADLEMPDARSVFDDLARGVGLHNPREAVRAASTQFVANLAAGQIELSAMDRATQLLSAVEDPLVESAFLSVYASGLAAAARYKESRNAAASLLAIVEKYRLDFALPFARFPSGIAEAGLRNWSVAERVLHSGISEACRSRNTHGEYCCLAVLLRLLAQRGRLREALTLVRAHSGPSSAPVPLSTYVEYVASHAFVLAVAGQLDEAESVIDSVRGVSRVADAVAFVAAVDAIIGVKLHRADAIDGVADFAEGAFATGALDALVTTYRAVPEILAILLRSPESLGVHRLVHLVSDQDLARAIGTPLAHESNPTALLTRREREVHELIQQGLSNREIAKLLYITEATAKQHVQHIFDKLGVRSRKTIAMQAALERATQATSAIADTGVGTDS